MKLHTVLDYDGFLPLFCDLTAAKTHEVTVARAQAYPRGSVLVFDRGYTDFSWWKDLDSTGVFFVTRAKDNLDERIVKSREIRPQDRGVILGDHTVEIGSVAAKRANLPPLRLVRFYDQKEDRSFSFITNQKSWTAQNVAHAYQQRWHIEVFFKFLKQHLNIKSFVGTSPNAVLIQIWTSLICFLLLKYLQAKAKYNWHMSNLSNFLKIASLAKIPLFVIPPGIETVG